MNCKNSADIKTCISSIPEMNQIIEIKSNVLAKLTELRRVIKNKLKICVILRRKLDYWCQRSIIISCKTPKYNLRKVLKHKNGLSEIRNKSDWPFSLRYSLPEEKPF